MSCNFMAYAKVCAHIRIRQPLAWLDLASVPMEEAVALCPGDAYLLPTELVMPVAWNESARFCLRGSDHEHEQQFRTDALCYMLSNNTIKSRDETRIWRYMPASDILNNTYFVSYLLRKSLSVQKHDAGAAGAYLGRHENVTQFDEGAFDYLVSRFGVRSMVDIGCGLPGMVYYALSQGIKAVGVDGDPSLGQDSPVVAVHDYVRGPCVWVSSIWAGLWNSSSMWRSSISGTS